MTYQRVSAPLRALRLALAVSVAAGCQGSPAPHPAASEPAGAPAVVVPKSQAEVNRPAQAKDEPAVYVRAAGQLGPGPSTLFIDIEPPDGAKLTLDSPLSVRGSGGIGLAFPRRLSGPLGKHSMPLRLPINVSDGATGPARVELTYYWCTDGNEAACRREQAFLDVELDLSGANAGGEAHLSYKARGS